VEQVQQWSAQIGVCPDETPQLLHVLHVDLSVFKIKGQTWSKCRSGARGSGLSGWKPLHCPRCSTLISWSSKSKVHTWS